MRRILRSFASGRAHCTLYICERIVLRMLQLPNSSSTLELRMMTELFAREEPLCVRQISCVESSSHHSIYSEAIVRRAYWERLTAAACAGSLCVRRAKCLNIACRARDRIQHGELAFSFSEALKNDEIYQVLRERVEYSWGAASCLLPRLLGKQSCTRFSVGN